MNYHNCLFNVKEVRFIDIKSKMDTSIASLLQKKLVINEQCERQGEHFSKTLVSDLDKMQGECFSEKYSSTLQLPQVSNADSMRTWRDKGSISSLTSESTFMFEAMLVPHSSEKQLNLLLPTELPVNERFNLQKEEKLQSRTPVEQD